MRETRYYRIVQAGQTATTGVATAGIRTARPRLCGALCRTAEEARAAARRGADFVALREPLESHELAALCEALSVPVFASGLTAAHAWTLGASGVNLVR